MGAGPSPLEVVAPEPTGDINNFADEEKSRDVTGFHCFGRQIARIDTAESDLRFGVSFRAGKCHWPVVDEVPDARAFPRGPLGHRFVRRVSRAPSLGKALGSNSRELGHGGAPARHRQLAAFREKVEGQRFTLAPVVGNLQHGRSA